MHFSGLSNERNSFYVFNLSPGHCPGAAGDDRHGGVPTGAVGPVRFQASLKNAIMFVPRNDAIFSVPNALMPTMPQAYS